MWRTKRIETPRCPMGQDAFVPNERVHDHDYGWALTSMEPHGRFTMVRIDRLNYRDIDVIKAPLCQDPSLEGVDKTRDWTPGIRIPSHPPLLAHFFSLCSARAERRPLCHFLRTPRRCFVDKLLSARWRILDELSRIPRFRRFQSRHITKNVNSRPVQKNFTKLLVVHYRTLVTRISMTSIVDSRSRPLYASRIGETIEHHRLPVVYGIASRRSRFVWKFTVSL